MPNKYFQFKEFRIEQKLSGMKVTTDACLFGAWVADDLIGFQDEMRVLDIGTGTGLLSLMLAQKAGKANIEAVEINSDAFEEATNNFKKSLWNNRLTCKHTSAQEYSGQSFDIIVCNPPFFKASQKGESKNKNDAIHSSLLSKEDLIDVIQKLLSKDGKCYILYPDWEMTDFIRLAKKSSLTPSKIISVRNQKNEVTFRKMAFFSHQEEECTYSEIIIRKADGKYTDEFWYLLKDYYLEYNNPALK